MKAESIRYRVADFLRQHPPFQYIDEEDLLDLVGGGRVKFHEGMEYVFEQGQARGPHLFVIQQGAVQLLVNGEKGEELRDMLGEGDLLGVGRFLGSSHHQHSARTCSDVILYALPAADFERLLPRYPAVSRYLASYFSVSATYANLPRSAASGGEVHTPPLELLRGRLTIVAPEAAAAEAARLLSARPGRPIAIVDAESRLRGVITDATLRDFVAKGAWSDGAKAEQLMTACPTATADLPANRYALAMAKSRSSVVALTESGTTDGEVLGLLTEADLTIACRHHPETIVRLMADAHDLRELVWLCGQGESTLERCLADRSALDGLMPMATELHGAAFTRLVRFLAEENGADAQRSETECCWFFFGEAGRGELLTRRNLEWGVIYADSPAGGEAEVRERVTAQAVQLSKRLEACGYSSPARSGEEESRCRSLSEWRSCYEEWIRDPILNQAYDALPYFDVRPVCGNLQLASQLRDAIRSELAGSASFVPLLANDSLANLPPLTFYRGLVVEDQDTQREGLDLERCALRPLIDVGRVFALAANQLDVTSTLERLASVAVALPQHEQLVAEAQEAFRVTLHCQRTNAGGADSSIDPARLSKYDQQLLKAAFRTILALLELTAAHFRERSKS